MVDWSDDRIDQLEKLVTSLRHDVRGIVTPVALGHTSFGCARVVPRVEHRTIVGPPPLKNIARSPTRMLNLLMKRRFSPAAQTRLEINRRLSRAGLFTSNRSTRSAPSSGESTVIRQGAAAC